MSDQLQKDAYEAVLKATGYGKDAVTQRRMDMLIACSDTERSIEDFAEEYGLHYQTVYTDVRLLSGMGLLELSPKKRDRRNLYRTNWNLVKQNPGNELRWRTSGGEFITVSQVIANLLFYAEKHAKVLYSEMAYALISNHENKRRRALDIPNYGVSHEEYAKHKLVERIEELKRMMVLLEQAVASPLWDKDDGWEMYKLPKSIDEDAASAILDEMEARAHNSDYYG